MNIIYPSDYFDNSKVDDIFEEEYHSAKKSGLSCLLLSTQHVSNGKYKFSKDITPNTPVIWRGWMLKSDEYKKLSDAVPQNGGNMLVSLEDYLSSHHITGWYKSCEKYTPDTVFVKEDDDFDQIINQLKWPAYFVKDYVKSLTTSRGSIAKNAEEIREIISSIKKFRGDIEGGISLRKVEDIIKTSERRYFSFRNNVYSSDGVVPDLVVEIAQHISSPFFSIDMVENSAGELRLIEIGDGQVSDTKEWNIDKFVQIFINA
ncbi:ATP-grasp domain-containing protein [Pectobacterium brasiliense]|uniref:ATP-grasp domain-containing protein n=1 Tax=Pectobacterium brasiliense TaxID=180957 RepID=UPI0015DE050C|nr:ATP-grasp domain-containing protein [Pectobacterium brasiliense]MBA0197222.1 ATP-grasp domain-containing protein [Pectobacterium brasiliense]MBN3094612.1 ATP-grasp domain-containing protein [Pectobacterium brasiliense]MBN3121771.1 ATP-grasp domain-containing protein [Pectobacterium brasiliense]MBN3138548.1 ATP-grasp domain-containing protein [Pectobacterium brasiliense]MBW5894967.1 ATP-grasp domain-containing protein [Pectobacterium brasiliense]